MTPQGLPIPIVTKDQNPALAPPISTIEDEHTKAFAASKAAAERSAAAATSGTGLASGVGAAGVAGHGLTGTHGASDAHGVTGTHGASGIPVVRNDLDALPGEAKAERHIAHHPFAHTTTEAGQKALPVARDRSATENAPLDVGPPKLPYGVTHTPDAGTAGRTMPDKSVHLATGDHQHKTDLNEKGKESIGAKIKHAIAGGGYELEK